jgi:FtsP/CotA-like multicopper oxidase with cupredoxin domain
MTTYTYANENRSRRRSFALTTLTGGSLLRGVFLLLCMIVALACTAQAQSADPADLICPRSAPGSAITPPPDLWSTSGVLQVTFTFQTTVDAQGLTRYCYITSTGLQSPTLHVYPGDQLIINFQNELPAATPEQLARGMKMPAIAGMAGMAMKGMKMPMVADASTGGTSDCPGSGIMTAETTNLHFHGLNVSPTCGQDNVINTMIQPGDMFTYNVQIPADEPPGLYWYHPHPHGFSEGQVQGGAAGALIVEGIQNVNTSLAGLPQRLFVLRDQVLPNSESNDSNIPAWDISVNYTPIPFPNYPPATVQTPPAEQEFWRVLNAAADTILNVQYVVNGVAQPVQVVAIDGYPIGAGGSAGTPQSESVTTMLLPPGARVEFVVTTPNVGDQAQLVTQNWDTGPDGDFDPTRPIADIVAQSTVPNVATGGTQAAAQLSASRLPSEVHSQRVSRFADLAEETPVAQRTLQFSEVLQDPSDPNSPTSFFITLVGQTPAVYNPSAPPNIVVHQGSVEDWTVQNTALEDHIFHIHQLHFQVMAINGQPVNDPAIRDTIDVPYWSGTGAYPSVTLRMDFRDANIIGTFVYHCHILAHEDGGMMGTIQVLPAGIGTTTAVTASSTDLNANANVTLTATVTPASAGGPVMLGTVQFADNGTNIGSAIPVSNSQAVLTTTLAADGNNSITATYSGDSTYTESVSNALAVTIEDFTFSATNMAIPAPGQAGTSTITVTGSANFVAPINFTCSLPHSLTEAACFVNPNSLTGSGQVTLTVNTTPAHSLSSSGVGIPPLGNNGRFVLGLVALSLALLTLWIPRQKWRVPGAKFHRARHFLVRGRLRKQPFRSGHSGGLLQRRGDRHQRQRFLADSAHGSYSGDHSMTQSNSIRSGTASALKFARNVSQLQKENSHVRHKKGARFTRQLWLRL